MSRLLFLVLTFGSCTVKIRYSGTTNVYKTVTQVQK
jgi:hypothetical protein